MSGSLVGLCGREISPFDTKMDEYECERHFLSPGPNTSLSIKVKRENDQFVAKVKPISVVSLASVCFYFFSAIDP